MDNCALCNKPLIKDIVVIRGEALHEHCVEQELIDYQNRADRHSDYMATYYPPEQRRASGGMF